MNREAADKLRMPFAPEKIGKLPRVTCGACRESRDRSCDKHQKSKCAGCGSWITSAHIHLDFVGHADATDRFLQVDPDWTWEPLAVDQRGLPAFDENGGLWIRLTIAGTTRLGYGDADGKRGANAVKEAIGDALRNAGLRFGVALDLWRKESADEVSASPPAQARARQEQQEQQTWDPIEQSALVEAWSEAIKSAADMAELKTIGQTLQAMKRKKDLSPPSYEHLVKAGAVRKGELNGGTS